MEGWLWGGTHIFVRFYTFAQSLQVLWTSTHVNPVFLVTGQYDKYDLIFYLCD